MAGHTAATTFITGTHGFIGTALDEEGGAPVRADKPYMRKGRFSELVVRYINGRDWLLKLPLRYTAPDGHVYEAPAYFLTDFARIPRSFCRVLPPTGDGFGSEWGPAAVIHDSLYRGQAVNGVTGQPLYVSREQADDIFLQGLMDLGVVKWKRQVLYRAVRLFGASAYKCQK